jgi:N utilization substance protein B
MPAVHPKHHARELALQALFLWDANQTIDLDLGRSAMVGPDDESAPDAQVVQTAIMMARSAWEHRAQSDQWVVRLAPQWPPRRQPAVDRNVLRLAMWEMTHTDTPPKVVIDEAIELAKRFSTENSPSFVNGVLDAVFREIRELKAEVAVTDLPAAAPPAEPKEQELL